MGLSLLGPLVWAPVISYQIPAELREHGYWLVWSSHPYLLGKPVHRHLGIQDDAYGWVGQFVEMDSFQMGVSIGYFLLGGTVSVGTEFFRHEGI